VERAVTTRPVGTALFTETAILGESVCDATRYLFFVFSAGGANAAILREPKTSTPIAVVQLRYRSPAAVELRVSNGGDARDTGRSLPTRELALSAKSGRNALRFFAAVDSTSARLD
jgi:hypothetical protein